MKRLDAIKQELAEQGKQSEQRRTQQEAAAAAAAAAAWTNVRCTSMTFRSAFAARLSLLSHATTNLLDVKQSSHELE